MFPDRKYRCIVIDPPWRQPIVGKYKRPQNKRLADIPYITMPLDEIAGLPIEPLADRAGHLWLWTTNAFLRPAFDLMQHWGFTYLTTVTWVKPSGLGAWFAHATQHCLFGYYKRCEFPLERYKPTHFNAVPRRHSEKPDAFYELVRKISPESRIDLFNRRFIAGFEGWGDESPYMAAEI
jgi:N6-adenosine-specific RNA methylase IME4